MTIRTKPRAPSHRPLGPEHDAVGLAGEEAFAARYGYRVDHEYAQRGDGGADFATYAGSVDVKTYRKPVHLLVEQGKVRADLYVLAAYREADGGADLLGWAARAEVAAAPVSDVGGFGVMSHALPALSLRPVATLDALFAAWCVGCGVRVVYPVETRPIPGRLGPADAGTVCIVCVMAGWTLVPAATIVGRI